MKIIHKIKTRMMTKKIKKFFKENSPEDLAKELLTMQKIKMMAIKKTIQDPTNPDEDIINIFDSMLDTVIGETTIGDCGEFNVIIEANCKEIDNLYTLIYLTRGEILPENIRDKYKRFKEVK